MKTLKSIMLGLTLLVASVAAKADGNQSAGALTKDNVLDIYTNAAVHGKLAGLDKALSKDVQLDMYRGEKAFKLTKQDVLESFKANENVEQACKCNTSIIEETKNSMVVKLDMKYDSYVRSNVITLARDGDGWKITKIEVRTA